MDAREEIMQITARARAAAASLSAAGTAAKNQVLTEYARLIRENREAILEANRLDLSKAAENGIRPAMVDRLRLTESRIDGICDSVLALTRLPDPVGMGECFTRPNGLSIRRIRVPLGVVGVIFESRPNVSADVFSMCLKTGNASILRGGRDAANSNRALIGLARRALAESGLDEDGAILLEDPDRTLVTELMKYRGGVDVLIPRGSASLIRSVTENARVPVIETGAGNCHVYVHEDADLEMAIRVSVNAKTSRPSVCNSCEGFLVHSAVAAEFLPRLTAALDEAAKCHVALYGCERTRAVIPAEAASDADYFTEYDDLCAHVKVVDSLDEAIGHINHYGTHHSDAILTKSLSAANEFTARVDSAAVYVNASTRFTDGGEFGFGAEIGISTQKLHARGPMGLEALTCDKYIVLGDGQVR